MLGVPKMSVGVSLPYFTSPSCTGGLIGFFPSTLELIAQTKKQYGGTLVLPLKKEQYE